VVTTPDGELKSNAEPQGQRWALVVAAVATVAAIICYAFAGPWLSGAVADATVQMTIGK
jgi:hypothetical protein